MNYIKCFVTPTVYFEIPIDAIFVKAVCVATTAAMVAFNCDVSEATRIIGALAGTTMRKRIFSAPVPDIRAATSRLDVVDDYRNLSPLLRR
ncbi:MAG: hypothetical protein ACREP3_05880, partial [Candidatus Binatia bacterium]